MQFVRNIRSAHQQAVDWFMRLAGQRLPEKPTSELTDEERILRARLMYEEVLETCNGLGVQVAVQGMALNSGIPISVAKARGYITTPGYRHVEKELLTIMGPLDLIEVVDGCGDVKVVTTGTLSACGVSDESVQLEVDESNLRKFSPGGYKDAGGKWQKPADWQPPNLLARLIEQGYEPAEEEQVD